MFRHICRTISGQLHCKSWLCKRLRLNADKELIHLINAKLRFESERSLKDKTIDVGQCSSILEHANGFNNEMAANNNNNNNINLHHHMEHLMALRSDVELIIVKLLGIDTIDYAHVGLLFDDVQCVTYNILYINSDLIQTHTETLANQLSTLQNSILSAQSGNEPSLSPTDAYGCLERLLDEISEQSFHLNPLRPMLKLDLQTFIRQQCATYEHLLANSIINQIVEESQSRFMTAGSAVQSLKSGNTASTRSSSVSGHYSPISSYAITPTTNGYNRDSGIKLINNNSTWQDNWLFKKHKENRSYHQYHLNSDIHYGYMALALSDPVPMLIPNPSQPFEGPMIGDSDIEQVSDLSEHNSETGSIEDLFSDLEEDEEDENDNEEVKR
ncbi:hypothetical protein BLOT_003430 [Blomia tropicalis]|nr:hypothetical protein BLOT_003430 [Blomia tropicalis]